MPWCSSPCSKLEYLGETLWEAKMNLPRSPPSLRLCGGSPVFVCRVSKERGESTRQPPRSSGTVDWTSFSVRLTELVTEWGGDALAQAADLPERGTDRGPPANTGRLRPSPDLSWTEVAVLPQTICFLGSKPAYLSQTTITGTLKVKLPQSFLQTLSRKDFNAVER